MKIYKNRIISVLAVALVLALMLVLFCACTDETTPSSSTSKTETVDSSAPGADVPDNSEEETDKVDYSKSENWAYYGVGEDKDADLFLICPTVDMGKDGNYNMSMDDTAMKESFVGALNMERGIYEDSTTMYAPYYRQMTFPVYSMTEEEMEPYLQIAYRDVAAAFEYYIENCNNDRPIILAGFSQGSQLLLMLMEEYFADSKYSDKLVAAYCIGWRVTEEQLDKYPHLKMAQGEDDTGVIISFNSEAEGVEDSLIVPNGTKTLGINPLNWKTDSTPADKSLNKGACFTKKSGAIRQETPELTGAYLDPERGTLRVTDVNPSDYINSLFPDGVYHLYDYQFFFRNLQENVAVRLQSYLNKGN